MKLYRTHRTNNWELILDRVTYSIFISNYWGWSWGQGRLNSGNPYTEYCVGPIRVDVFERGYYASY